MVVDIKSVLILDGVGPQCAEILSAHGISSTTKPKISKEDLLQEIPKHDALVVRSATQVTSEVLAAGTKLKVVGRAGAGVDNIDVKAAQARNIGVINAPGANALSACELTCGLMLSLARHIVPAAAALRNGRWERAAFTGTEVAGRTLAILGLGRVGREVAVRMNAFGMKASERAWCDEARDFVQALGRCLRSYDADPRAVSYLTQRIALAIQRGNAASVMLQVVGFDPFVSAEQCQQFHATKMELDQIWPVADYITLHTPLIDSTYKFINKDVLSRCKKGVKIINVGRGALIDEPALLEALKSGQVAGAALDVFEEEPPTSAITLEIIQQPGVLATPHLGASTKEAQVRVGQEIAEQFVNLTKPGTYPTFLAEVTKVFNK